jgi:hypothetical protein
VLSVCAYCGGVTQRIVLCVASLRQPHGPGHCVLNPSSAWPLPVQERNDGLGRHAVQGRDHQGTP